MISATITPSDVGPTYEQIVRIHASSGTTGKPTVGVYTQRDLDNWSDQVARVAVGRRRHSRRYYSNFFWLRLFTGALGLHYGLEKLGATVIPASAATPKSS